MVWLGAACRNPKEVLGLENVRINSWRWGKSILAARETFGIPVLWKVGCGALPPGGFYVGGVDFNPRRRIEVWK
jgi:hypothetical protein